MNKYEELFREILTKTKEGSLKWKQLRKGANSDVVFNSAIVWRQFTADFIRNHEAFTLLLLEKKHEDADSAYENYSTELLILLDNEVVTTIDDSTVLRSELLSLISAVESRSDRSQKLFGPE